MASEQPLPDRCGARVVDKVGLEVHDDELGRTFTDDGRMERVVVERGASVGHKQPTYGDVIGNLRNGYEVTAVDLAPSDADDTVDDDQLVRVQIKDDDPYVTNRTTDLQGYCERYPMEDRNRCYVHTGQSMDPEEKKDHGIEHITHGMRAKRSKFYRSLDETDKRFVEKLVDSWVENAPFDRDNFAKVNELYRIAIDELRAWKAQGEAADGTVDEGGFIVEQTIDYNQETGEEITVEDENPLNLAYDRLDRTKMKKLKELGVLDDPESQKADSIESITAKFEELE